MNWGILQDGKCAKCGSRLKMGLLDERYTCTSCDFTIGREKFEMIAYKGFHPHESKRHDDNLSDNMGHNIISEGDSPL